MKYFLVAGEASGDLHASNLMKELQKLDVQAEFRFFGGDKMASVGGHLVKHYRYMAYMGVVAVVAHARTILANMTLCKQEICSWKPDVLILIDYAGFNLRIAKFVKTNLPSLPVHFYISPKIWAWKEYRIKAFRRYIDKMYVILPFESTFFAKHNFPVSYVGNPCVDSVSSFRANHPTDEAAFRVKHQLDERSVLAVLPGSRKGEIKGNLPLMMEVASNYPHFQLVVSGAPGMDSSFYDRFVPAGTKLLFNETYNLLEIAHTAIVTSGTATLETALFSTPQVVCFAVWGGHAANWVFRHFMHVPYFSLVNLIAGRTIVPELMGGMFTRIHLTAALEPLLSDTSDRADMLQGYKEVQEKLGKPGASERTAVLIFNSLQPK